MNATILSTFLVLLFLLVIGCAEDQAPLTQNQQESSPAAQPADSQPQTSTAPPQQMSQTAPSTPGNIAVPPQAGRQDPESLPPAGTPIDATTAATDRTTQQIQVTAEAPSSPQQPTPGPQATAEAEAAQVTLQDALQTSPRFDEQDNLALKLEQINPAAFSLNPNLPYSEREIPAELPFEEYLNHPYIHLFPDMMETTREIADKAASQGDSHPKSFRYSYRPNTKVPRTEYTIESFIHSPWFEPWTDATVTSTDFGTGEFLNINSGTNRNIGTPYFGKDSTREVLANAVSSLIQSALVEGAEPHIPDYYSDIRYPNFTPPDPDHRLRLAFYLFTGSNSRFPAGNFRPPQITWQFLHPELPIIRVVAKYKNTEIDYRSPEHIRDNRNPTPSDFTIEFVVAFQHRWNSFSDPDRWVLKYTESLQPNYHPDSLRQCGLSIDRCHYTHRNGALDPNQASVFPNYWHVTDYMQHSLIGPVVMTVHRSQQMTVGVHSTAPDIAFWPAPGPILNSEQLLIPETNLTYSQARANQPLERYRQRYPFPGSPNPGYPLPGHVMTYEDTKPGSDIWNSYGLGPEWE